VKTLGILLFTVALSSLLPRHGNAAVYNSSGTPADVQRIHNTVAQAGDTIMVPSGQFIWSTPVTISKAIKLKGAGSGRIIGNSKSSVAIGTGTRTFVTTRAGLPISPGQVLLIGKMPSSPGYPTTNARGYWMQGTVTSYSGTTLVMNITSTGGSGAYQFWWIAERPLTTIINTYNNGHPGDNGASPLVEIRQSAAGSTELSGIRFVQGASSVSAATGVDGGWTGPKTLIHDCWFETGGGSPSGAIFAGTNQVLIWNCSFDDTWSRQAEAIQVAFIGNTSWSTNSTMGTADVNGATNLYVEDCDFHSYLTAVDFDNNSRVVFRHNLLDNCTQGNHGADTSTIGVRHFELYNNELVFDTFGDCNTEVDLQWFFWVRGGTGVITDNILPRITSTCTGTKGNIRLSVLNTRRSSGPYCCWTQYPAPHQVGQGYGPGAVFHQYTSQCGPYSGDNYSYYTYREPLYIWNNTGTAGNLVGLDEDTEDQCGLNQHVQTYVQAGRDYITGPKPGYQKFTYPHPLRGAAAATGTGKAVVRDFNSDGHPDYVLQNANTRQTAIWYLNNNTYVSGAYGPTLAAGWALRGLADFNLDSHSDYALLAPNTHQTALWYMSGPTFIGGAYGPPLPNGWELVGTGDFNGDNKPDYVLYDAGTHQTAAWYLNNNVRVGSGFGPTLPGGWTLAGVADFDGDGHPDYLLYYPSSGYTAIGYLSGLTLVGAAWGPIIPIGWTLVATADFNGDGKPDYVLYNANSRQTAIWYLNNNVFVSGAFGPTVPAGWSLTAP
jgi:hypothetical protein